MTAPSTVETIPFQRAIKVFIYKENTLNSFDEGNMGLWVLLTAFVMCSDAVNKIPPCSVAVTSIPVV